MDRYTQIIEAYLSGSMNESEKQRFEAQLLTDELLQTEFKAQQAIMKGMENYNARLEIKKAVKKYKIQLKAKYWVAAIVSVILVAGVLYLSFNNNKEANPSELLKNEYQSFMLNNTADTVIETQGGIVFSIPANAFGTDATEIELEIKEALKPEDIIKQGLSTTSNGELLETAGMFYINAKANGHELKMVKPISVNVPTDKKIDDMMVFDGEVGVDGVVNWVNPKQLERDLQTFDILSLDFYPKDYLPTLLSLGCSTNRRYTDSLYYSFSGYVMDGYEIVNNTQFRYVTDSSGVRTGVNDMLGAFEIDPSRIKAIKDPKFNNTILATREFQERIKYIHTLCNPKFLDIYIQHIDQPMFYADSICAANGGGPVFTEFYKRRDGGVKIGKLKRLKLQHYFNKKYEAYRIASEKTWAKHRAELADMANKTNLKHIEHQKMEEENKEQLFNEEYCMNLVDAYRQLGEKKECPVKTPPPAPNYYSLDITTTGWKNLDRYVFESTAKRESLEYVNDNGEKAIITYSEVRIKVSDYTLYDKVLVYLIPDSLSTYQRVTNEKAGVFKEKLNGLLNYQLFVLAYKGDQAYYCQQKQLLPGDVTVILKSIKSNEVSKLLSQYSRSKSNDLKSEIQYQQFDIQEKKRQIALQKEENQRSIIARSIFSCWDVEDTINAKAPKSQQPDTVLFK